MNTLQAAIWRRIDEYAFDDIDSALTFSARLARDNGWSPAFAKRALQEYKRFILLAVTAGHPVTPSDEVDQVWHLHLLYTRSYWEDFCPLLGGPLHHGPTRGGTEEGKKFNDWYGNTLQSYAQVFAAAPPPEIWPEPARRFGDAAYFRRINTRACWVVPKPRLHLSLVIAAVATPLVWLSGCRTSGDISPVAAMILLFIVVVVIGNALVDSGDRNKNNKKDGGGGCGGGGGGDSGGDGGSGCGGGGGCGGCGG